MTEQTPPETVEPKSLPEQLRTSASQAPNDLTPPEWRRTALIAWSLIGVVFAAGVALIAFNWRSADLPRLPDGPIISFDLPEFDLRFPDLESPIDRAERRGNVEPSPPSGMVIAPGGSDAQAVGRIDKPREDAPAPLVIETTEGANR